MVVCSPTVIAAAQTCPITPTAIHTFPAAICPLSPVPGMPCTQRFPPASMVHGTPILATPDLSTSPVLQFGTNLNATTPLNMSGTILACNAITPATVVPYNQSIQQAVIAYSNGQANSLPTATTTQVLTGNSSSGYSQQVITTFVPASNGTTPAFTSTTMVPCTQRLLPCDPTICPVSPTALPGTPAVCTIPTTTASHMRNSSTVCPLSSNVLTVPSWKQSYGMEQVWQCEFQTLFSQYGPHTWILLPVNQKPLGVWNTNVDSAKVRFCCEDCGHGWTSMKGRVAFWFIFNPSTGEGVVCLKLYGQQCDRCKTGNYEPAMWYPEEVVKVLVNIYNKVGQAYYGFQQAPYHRARRPGKPRTPHNSELCQACKDGVCSERR